MGFYQDQVVPLLTGLSMRNKNLAAYRKRVVPEATGRDVVGRGVTLNSHRKAEATLCTRLPRCTATSNAVTRVGVVAREKHSRLTAGRVHRRQFLLDGRDRYDGIAYPTGTL